jgi:hypothetical protein
MKMDQSTLEERSTSLGRLFGIGRTKASTTHQQVPFSPPTLAISAHQTREDLQCKHRCRTTPTTFGKTYDKTTYLYIITLLTL